MKKVEINDAAEEVVNRLVESGRYETADQVVDVSLRLLSEYEAQQEEKLKLFREAIAVGMEDIRNGNVAPLDIEAIKKKAREQYERRQSPA